MKEISITPISVNLQITQKQQFIARGDFADRNISFHGRKLDIKNEKFLPNWRRTAVISVLLSSSDRSFFV